MDARRWPEAKRKPMLLIAIGILLAANVAAFVWGRFAPLDATVERSAASLCRRDYADARDAADSAVIDERVWEVDHRGWRRLPSCGELREGRSPYLAKE